MLCAVIMGGNTSAALEAIGSSNTAVGGINSEASESPVSAGARVTTDSLSPGPGPRGWQSSDGPQILPARFSYDTTGSCSPSQHWITCNATVSSPPCLQLYQTALDNVVLCSNDPQYLTVSSSGTSLDFAYMVRWAALSALLTLLLVLLCAPHASGGLCVSPDCLARSVVVWSQ